MEMDSTPTTQTVSDRAPQDAGQDWYVTFNVPVAPNAFHRAMQRLLLGIRWRKLPETP